MADGYWKHGDALRQASAAQASLQVSMKRPRSDHGDVSGGLEYVGYHPREEGRMGYRVIRDTKSIDAAYERYLRDRQIVSYSSGESLRPVAGGMGSHPVDDMHMMGVGVMDGQSVGYGTGRSEIPLPPDASSTLYVEGLPANCTRREVSHIFRPFAGFREIRLVNKDSRFPGADPFVLCFVDFSNPSQAAVALDALQGYKFDMLDRDSANLRLQFARFPGPRSAGRPCGSR
ncbi:RNA-binding protein 1 isoform X2 [Elaeis guineensis]|uniref:RNA-binding protein 1 isoform X2 n=1 Tax=Elaeis guineensis var. tenera TaxID=51953 RepID=A0A6I9R2B5_ELAGV|nr:RNA-binding protein 1 isoform X2 [Elaeis guineensis]XP_029119923.1 RNA-binding protein 1 isoform X2 [Elaeis guineensis]XP_029119924.1 RNA-binding protein 1 isoform X2 [Elaeis guineensis]XP_029119925.1 RNA-binding protein 1 isoform X2 [Elaeis guineensis]